MKKAHYWLTLLAFLGASLVAASAVAQQDYATFKTNDEENNIEVFKQASPSVVYITNSRLVRRSFYSLNPQEIPQGSGSGFIWSRDGYVVTNFHVIQQASRLTVTLQDGSAWDADVVGAEPDKDLAVLRNSLGQLVGVNTAIYSPTGASSGIGFAIPANTVAKIVPELITFGRVQTPTLGISLLPPQYAEYYRQNAGILGVIVMDVIEGGSPESAGMRGLQETARGIALGDVITRIDDEVIDNEDDLLNALENRRAGDVVSVTTQRDTETLTYQIELQASQAQ